MNWGVIGTLVAKDISLYFKNRFFALITVLALVAYTVVFFVMPASVNETVEIGIYAPNLPVGILDRLAGDGVDFVAAPSREAFEATILGGDQPVGLVLEAGTVARLVAGQQGRIEVLFATALPEDFRDLYTTVLGELGFLLSGRPLAVEIDEQVLGPDLAGQQIPPRQRLLPMLAAFILMMETMGLASLISTEVEEGTLQALLVTTPMSMRELFVGKGLTGVTLAVRAGGVTDGRHRRPRPPAAAGAGGAAARGRAGDGGRLPDGLRWQGPDLGDELGCAGAAGADYPLDRHLAARRGQRLGPSHPFALRWSTPSTGSRTSAPAGVMWTSICWRCWPSRRPSSGSAGRS